MTQKVRFLMSLDKDIMSDIDRVVEAINEQKSREVSKTNRQAVVHALVQFALRQDVEYSSMWTKDVSVSLKQERITLT